MVRFAGPRRAARAVGLAAVMALAFGLAGCGDAEVVWAYPASGGPKGNAPIYTDEKTDSIFGEDGFNLLELGRTQEQDGGAGLGVNSFLWRATLDTIAFMPLTSADPFGGVIITDWYSPPEAPAERFKMNVYILGRQLRADGVKVAVFRQRINRRGAWMDSTLKSDTATNLENQILTRARQLRLAATR